MPLITTYTISEQVPRRAQGWLNQRKLVFSQARLKTLKNLLLRRRFKRDACHIMREFERNSGTRHGRRQVDVRFCADGPNDTMIWIISIKLT